jgi:hypothetical protein
MKIRSGGGNHAIERALSLVIFSTLLGGQVSRVLMKGEVGKGIRLSFRRSTYVGGAPVESNVLRTPQYI